MLSCFSPIIAAIVKMLLGEAWKKGAEAKAVHDREVKIDENAKHVAKEMEDAKTQEELDQADRDLLGH